MGHAVRCAKTFIGNEPFAVLLGDDIVDAEKPCLKQMIEVFDKYQASILGVQHVEEKNVSKYGIIDCTDEAERIYKTDGISAFIISLWCGKPFFSGIHTMFCILDKGRITVYNRYNQDIHERIYPDFKSFAGDRKIISIYSVAV